MALEPVISFAPHSNFGHVGCARCFLMWVPLIHARVGSARAILIAIIELQLSQRRVFCCALQEKCAQNECININLDQFGLCTQSLYTAKQKCQRNIYKIAGCGNGRSARQLVDSHAAARHANLHILCPLKKVVQLPSCCR